MTTNSPPKPGTTLFGYRQIVSVRSGVTRVQTERSAYCGGADVLEKCMRGGRERHVGLCM